MAVKWVRCSSEWQEARFRREVEILIKLRHPCIVPILGWSGGDSDIFEIHMKLAANGSLTDYLGRGRHAHLGIFRGATQQARLICEIVMGMKYVHSRGIIHRDLKPGNIVLNDGWHGLICDFGLSRTGWADGPPTPDAGTYEYAAPEQRSVETLDGEEPLNRYRNKVDVFTFGLVAHEIIAGDPPPNPNPPTEMREPPAYFGTLMQKLIHQCWSLEPSRRPSFADIFETFKSNHWAILPGADAKAIAERIAEVTRLEDCWWDY
jgi:serine/threonine protein kinase